MFQFVKRHATLSLAFLAVLAAMVFFGTRLFMLAVDWKDPAHKDQAIAGWMTPRYVARSWHLPREVMIEVLDPKFDVAGPRMTLADLAELQGRDLQEVIHDLEVAIETFRATRHE